MAAVGDNKLCDLMIRLLTSKIPVHLLFRRGKCTVLFSEYCSHVCITFYVYATFINELVLLQRSILKQISNSKNSLRSLIRGYFIWISAFTDIKFLLCVSSNKPSLLEKRSLRVCYKKLVNVASNSLIDDRQRIFLL